MDTTIYAVANVPRSGARKVIQIFGTDAQTMYDWADCQIIAQQSDFDTMAQWEMYQHDKQKLYDSWLRSFCSMSNIDYCNLLDIMYIGDCLFVAISIEIDGGVG